MSSRLSRSGSWSILRNAIKADERLFSKILIERGALLGHRYLEYVWKLLRGWTRA
jgi:hypothetical protein